MKRLLRAATYVVPVALVLLVAVFVWPTQYRAISVDTSHLSREEWGTLFPLAARENRFTGEVQFLTMAGWIYAFGAGVGAQRSDPVDELKRMADQYGADRRSRTPMLMGIGGALAVAGLVTVFALRRRRVVTT